jgi:isopenicillin-N N-acyltransferase like protein
MPVTEFPIYEARGSARELGRGHGESARLQIRFYLDCLKASLRLSDQAIRQRALKFQPFFETQCPHLLEEVCGLAEGAGIQTADALALQLRGELAGIRDEACTAFAIRGEHTVAGQTLCGQNSDNPPEMMEAGYLLKLIPDDRPRLLMWTFGGMIGYHGINEHGVAHFANALGGGPSWKFALSHYPLKRLLLEQKNAAGVRDVFRRIPVCSNGNYVLSMGLDSSGRHEISDVELTSEGPFELPDDGSGIIVHTNHYRCADHACESNYVHSLPDSFDRQGRMEQLIQEHLVHGQLSVPDLQRFLSDHSGAPGSICRHQDPTASHSMLSGNGLTVAAIIAEPQSGRMHIARGNPCQSKFVTCEL